MPYLTDSPGLLDQPFTYDIYGRRVPVGGRPLPAPMVMPAPVDRPRPAAAPSAPPPDLVPAQAELRAYNPTWRDNVANLLQGLGMPREVTRGVLGSTGIGYSGGPGGAPAMADLFPPTAIAFGANEAQRAAEEGNPLGATLNAMAMLPGAKPVKKLVNPQALGFNYGQPVAAPLPKEWNRWNKAADKLRQSASTTEESAQSWAQEMALRDVRIATTPKQRKTAEATAHRVFSGQVPLGTFPTTTPRKVANVTNAEGGYTVKLDTGDVPKTGFMVGMHPNTDPRTTVAPGRLMPSTVQRHVATNTAELNKPNVHLGTWTSGGSGYVDNAMRFDPALNNAQRRAAIYGYPTKQIAMFDLAKKAELPITPWQDYIMSKEFSGPGGRLDQLYQRGYGLLGGKPWWENGVFKQLWGDRFPQFASFLAATSPNNGIRMNLIRATEYMRRMINGEPVIQPNWRVPEGSVFLRPGTKIPMEGSSGLDPNLRRAAAGELVSGPKVSDIEQAEVGNPAAAPIDRWMARSSEDPAVNAYAAASPGDITDPNYAFMRNEMFPKAAKELSSESPMQFSAKVWTGIMDTARETGQLFGVPTPGLAGIWTPYHEEFVNLIREAAAKKGISADRLWKELQKGGGSLATSVLAIAGVPELIRRMTAKPPEGAAADQPPPLNL